LAGYQADITGDSEIYHIYIKDECVYHSLNETQFQDTWKQLTNMVGLMKTDITAEDITYEKLPAGIGAGGGSVIWKEPEGSDSY
jgi:hypothetical protein